MAATYYPIVLEKGATFNVNVVWNGSNGNPMDLTGYDAQMSVFQDPNYFTPVIEASTTGNGMTGTTITLGGAAGSIAVQLSTSAVGFLTDGLATVYGLTVLSPTGTFTRLFEGPVTLKPLLVDWVLDL